MATSKIMLAAAGSGKTYYIANELDPNKKNLIITFTNQNVNNLREEIIKKYGTLPRHTNVMTFSSFIYRWILKPVEPILKIGNKIGIFTTGVEICKEPEPQTINRKPNPKYFSKDDLRHYLYFDKYYVSRMSALFVSQPSSTKKIILDRLAKFCDNIYFDELQDFMDNDFKILQTIIHFKGIKALAVGDFYQHSVSKSSFNSSRPFKIKNSYITKEEYKRLFKKYVQIDETTLIKSRRVPNTICKLLNEKLDIQIESIRPNKGHYELIETNSKIIEILEDKTIIKLFYKDSKNFSCKPNINWGYSKGSTYQKICIILTQKFEAFLEEHFSAQNLTPTQINTLYVAITRATDDVYFIKEKDFKRLKPKYYKK